MEDRKRKTSFAMDMHERAWELAFATFPTADELTDEDYLRIQSALNAHVKLLFEAHREERQMRLAAGRKLARDGMKDGRLLRWLGRTMAGFESRAPCLFVK